MSQSYRVSATARKSLCELEDVAVRHFLQISARGLRRPGSLARRAGTSHGGFAARAALGLVACSAVLRGLSSSAALDRVVRGLQVKRRRGFEGGLYVSPKVGVGLEVRVRLQKTLIALFGRHGLVQQSCYATVMQSNEMQHYGMQQLAMDGDNRLISKHAAIH